MRAHPADTLQLSRERDVTCHALTCSRESCEIVESKLARLDGQMLDALVTVDLHLDLGAPGLEAHDLAHPPQEVGLLALLRLRGKRLVLASGDEDKVADHLAL